ncbi:restriction endonuclease subunit S [Desulfurivibrio dismutans]|uniref:restriction endonuclease subunit S n=1 Tax=Desulfurivibrio dismutans TaxID=1398908 RepID=UPI0023DC255B|nr:restriction endonuclease subunit S [Desulfurivibrio alkaliphilus]MDF1614831.1 restriction endonuclease subunit S [Desulfurivibrio alkaliphilus]
MGGEWNSTTLDKIVNIRTGKLDSNRATNNGLYPFFTCAPDPLNIDEFAYDEDAILLAGNNANGVFHVNRYKGKFNAYQRTYIITAKDDKKVSLDFIYYTLKTLGSAFESLSLGTATKFLTMKVLAPFEVNLPLLGTQKAIAHILGCLDDKIELNRRMNATLEAMARALFKSWFVDFDPVIDNALAAGNPIPEPLQTRAKARKSLGDQRKPLPAAIQKQFPSRFVFTEEMGWVPEGWEVKKIGEILELAYGKSLPATKRRAGDIPVYGSGGMSGFHNEKLVDGPGVVIGRKGTVGSLYWVDGNFFPIDTVFYVVSKIHVPLYWLYQSLQLIDIKSMGADSAVPGVNRNAVYARSLAIPAKVIFDGYLTQVGAYNSRSKELSGQNETLSGLRDTLLPKMISGQLRVPDAEQLLAEVT